MNQSDFRKLLTLLIINNVPKFRNSFDLGKVLSWKFGIIELVEVTQSLVNDKLVVSTLNKGINHYEITNEGLSYLKENYNRLHSDLKEKYPTESEFIDSIWNERD